MSSALERRRALDAQATQTTANPQTEPETAPDQNGLALSGRDMKYMAIGGTMFVIAVIIGIKSLIPVQQIVKTVAKAV